MYTEVRQRGLSENRLFYNNVNYINFRLWIVDRNEIKNNNFIQKCLRNICENVLSI